MLCCAALFFAVVLWCALPHVETQNMFICVFQCISTSLLCFSVLRCAVLCCDVLCHKWTVRRCACLLVSASSTELCSAVPCRPVRSRAIMCYAARGKLTRCACLLCLCVSVFFSCASTVLLSYVCCAVLLCSMLLLSGRFVAVSCLRGLLRAALLPLLSYGRDVYKY